MVSVFSPCNNTDCPFYQKDCSSTKSYKGESCKHYFDEFAEQPRVKAHALVDAYFDGKLVLMKDPQMGINYWTQAIGNNEFWSYLEEFCKNTDKYKIVEK